MKLNMFAGSVVVLGALSVVGCGEDGTTPGSGASSATSSSDTSSTATSSSGTGGAGGQGGSGMGGQGGEGGAEVVDLCSGFPVTNNTTSCKADAVFPLPGEETHWIAERLTPPSYPFTVTKVRYVLRGGVQGSYTCDNGLAHQAEVFVGTDLVPAATPIPADSIAVPATASVDGLRVVDHELTVPIILQTGDFLFVAVQNAGVAPDGCICFESCTGTSFVQDANYWSNQGDHPFPWTTLESSNIKANYTVCADGMP